MNTENILGTNMINQVDSARAFSRMEGTEPTFEFTDVNGFALPSEYLPNEYKRYITAKYQLALPLLRNNWRIMLPTAPSFIKLVDKNNVAFNVTVKELNKILLSGYFTAEEQQTIKKMRYQGRNNQAAKVMRDKYKEKDIEIITELEALQKEKQTLMVERSKLAQEISYYRNVLSN